MEASEVPTSAEASTPIRPSLSLAFSRSTSDSVAWAVFSRGDPATTRAWLFSFSRQA